MDFSRTHCPERNPSNFIPAYTLPTTMTDLRDYDVLYKVRPLYDVIRKHCHELLLEGDLCIDEQMLLFRGTLDIKQYVKGKPDP